MNVVTARPHVFRAASALILALGLGASAARSLHAQGVTTGAVRGTVTDQQGQPIVGATVQLVNSANGLRFHVATSDGGRYFMPNVIVGNYAAEARAIGYRPQRKTQQVQLGQVADLAFQLEASTVELTAINVAGVVDPQLNSTRTGTTASVSENLIRNLPSLTRDFNTFTATSALVNGGSVAGSSDRFNSLQIDGGTNADLFGLNSSRGRPGGGNGSRPMTVEAIQEFQVLIAPYDVRQGGFTGGLVNAVTRSGTNQLHGSLFGFMQNENLQGRDTAGLKAAQFDRRFYGFSLGGPIVRDRFHFFVAAEWRAQETPFTTRNISESDTNALGWTRQVGLSARTAQRLRDFATTNLGFDPGDWRQPIIPNPDRNIFVKLTGQLGGRSQLELAFNNVRSSEYRQTHDPFGANIGRIREGYQFNNSGYDNAHENQSIRARLNTQFSSRLTNELIISAYTVQDLRQLKNRVPLLIIGADSAGAHFAMGAERFSHLNTLDQDVLEVANNITYATGNHVFTLGGRAERFGFVNGFFPASLGAWYFPDTTRFFNPSLCRGVTTNGTTTDAGTGGCRYERALPASAVFANGRTDGPIADFTFSQYGVYGQDQITVSRGFTLTFGLRADVTRLPKPTYNILLDTLTLLIGPRAGQDFAVRTDSRPTDALLLSPRVGFNFDLRGDQSLFLRGGAGIFSGRTPYVWASNAYTNTGLEQVQLQCTSNTGIAADTFPKLPTFSVDPTAQASACPNSAGLAAPRPAIVFFDPNFKLPQNFRATLGLDRRLPWNMVFTMDLLYTRAINQFALEDMNLVEAGTSVGEGQRRLYGVFSGTNTLTLCRAAGAPGATPAGCGGGAARGAGWVLPNDVLRQFNTNEDYSYSASFTLNKRFSGNMEFLAAYAYSRAYDLMSPTSDISNSLLNFSTLDGTFKKRNLRPSFFDTPHSVRLSGTTTLPYGVRFSLFYSGTSGRPYAYRYNSDVNGDNFNGNDLFYVPMNSDDIRLCRGGSAGCSVSAAGASLTDSAHASQYALLDKFINGEQCLREQRGRIMERNSCRNPWRSFVDARIGKSFAMRGHNLELTANMFNVLSFLGIGGEIRETSGNENIPLLTRAGYQTAHQRGVYTLLLPNRQNIDIFASRWKLELGGRYSF